MRTARFLRSCLHQTKLTPNPKESTLSRSSSLLRPKNILCRRQSSVAAAEAEDEEEEGFSARPRLQALREKLYQENASGASPPIQISRTKTSSKSKFDTADLVEPTTNLKALAAQLPDVPAHQTLTDQFHRQHSYLRISLTERCNLRCTYCMPEDGVPLQARDQLLQTHEILQLAQYFCHQGVTKFRLTGGEPTLRHDLVDIVAGLSALGAPVGMTTNGVTLAKQLPALVEAGLSSVNVSLDTLDATQFSQLTRRPPAYLHRVWQALEVATDLMDTVKVNCVVMRGVNDVQVADFCALTERFPGLAVRFIEYMPFSENGWNPDKLVPYRELVQQVDVRPLPETDPHDTTKWFATPTGGRVGFITSMSSHFCAGCNRLRLGADGQMKVCLFDGSTELSLRDALRQGLSQTEMNKLVHAAVQKKHFSLGGHKDPQDISDDAANNKPMTLIGG